MTLSLLTRLQFFYVAALGACLGSFVNVVVARLPHEQSIVRPGSRCPHCGAPIGWYDNIPLVSYLLLRGRCRRCRGPVALRYLLVEVAMAGLAAALFVRFGWSWSLLAWLPLSAALLAITFLDIDHWWVPDVITYPGMLWALGKSFLPGEPGPWAAAAGVLPAFMLLSVGWAFARLTGKEGLGLGDVKLLALLGLAMGISDALTLLLLASMQGALLGSVIILAGGHRAAAGAQVPAALQDDAEWQPHPHAVPFGPFLTLATFELLLLPQVFGAWHHRLAAWLLRLMQ